tara:strand:- start:2269 stop:2589 length:321 start_codon:yes stop_codon:yes gene_type:complete
MEEWKIVKQDERYTVRDNSTLENLIASTTLLNPNCSTTGHSHKGQEEVYIFREGRGTIEIDEIYMPVKKGDIVFVEDGCFHRVHNNFDDSLEFVCVFAGKRKHERE